MELGGTHRRPRQAGVGHGLLRAQLGPEVAQRDLVRPDDADVHQVPHPGSRRGLDQLPGRLVIALGATRQVHDDLGPVDCGLDPLALEQITGHILDAIA